MEWYVDLFSKKIIGFYTKELEAPEILTIMVMDSQPETMYVYFMCRSSIKPRVFPLFMFMTTWVSSAFSIFSSLKVLSLNPLFRVPKWNETFYSIISGFLGMSINFPVWERNKILFDFMKRRLKRRVTLVEIEHPLIITEWWWSEGSPSLEVITKASIRNILLIKLTPAVQSRSNSSIKELYIIVTHESLLRPLPGNAVMHNILFLLVDLRLNMKEFCFVFSRPLFFSFSLNQRMALWRFALVFNEK